MLNATEFLIYMLTVESALSPESIAFELKRKRSTVKRSLNRIFVKLGVNSSLQMLVAYHRKEGNL